jgi:hypothetical protein
MIGIGTPISHNKMPLPMIVTPLFDDLRTDGDAGMFRAA